MNYAQCGTPYPEGRQPGIELLTGLVLEGDESLKMFVLAFRHVGVL